MANDYEKARKELEELERKARKLQKKQRKVLNRILDIYSDFSGFCDNLSYEYANRDAKTALRWTEKLIDNAEDWIDRSEVKLCGKEEE